MFQLLVFVGIAIRLVLIPLAGFKADVAFWKGWGLAAADKGVLWMMTNTNYNYPPGFSYVLWIVNKIYGLFKDSHNINEYWLDGNVFYLFLIKLITIIADLLIVWLIIKIGRIVLNSKSRIGYLLALFYFLNPAVIYDGVVWGQVDQFGLALFLSSVYLLFTRKPGWAAVIFTISCLMKFQNIIFIPLFFLLIWRKFSFEILVRSIAYSVFAFLVVVLPFIATKQTDKLIWLLTVNADWFPWYSLNAFNVWWIKSGLNGMGLVDKHLIFGVTSAKQLGLFMFIFVYFIGSVTVFFSAKEKLLRNFILACVLVTFAFFHLLTQSHERYLFPVMGLLPILIVFYLTAQTTDLQKSHRLSTRNSSKLIETNRNFSFYSQIIFYCLVSFFFFLNMYLSMGWNYPDQVIPAFTKQETLSISFWISIMQIVLFAVFVFWFFKEGLIENKKIITLFCLSLMVFVLGKNVNYLLGRPVLLTSLKPVSYRQDYLEPQYNKTVESARGVKFWNRLSVNYYFYDNGIGSHADSDITYHLGKRFTTFTTDYGIDTEADASAKAYFLIRADGKELFKSKVRGRFDKPEQITLNITNVNYLTLSITKAGESNYGVHADWLNPHISK